MGRRLGSYEVLGALGAGGMGEVYRARDTRLGRDVALKVLPAAVAGNPARLARFEREARLLAALNHPHIAAIHGLEDQAGAPVLVMELVEGTTLAERLRRGPLPLREGLEIARQIAHALEAAHDKGIVHRDLKPSNVQITPESQVKLLDFGLGKALEPETPAPDVLSQLSTETPPTGVGVVMGTAPYMSPEQARGETADKRVDVWSFGCVLYELLSGKRAFVGATGSDAIAAVLEREPDWSALPVQTPASVRSLLRRCLQKDRADRLRDIADARIELKEALGEIASGSTAGEVAASAPGQRPPAWRRWTTAALAVAGVLTLILARRPAARSSRPTRFNLSLPAGAALYPIETAGATLTLTPDGRKVVFAASVPGRPWQLFLRALDEMEATPIAGTEGGYRGFLSPDGEWLGFASEDSQLKVVPLRGGTPRTLCEVRGLRGATWGRNGTIVFAPASSGLWLVSSEGGTPEPLSELDARRNESSHRWPVFLPGEKAVLFGAMTSSMNEAERTIEVLTLADRKRRALVRGASHPRLSPDGYLLYAQGDAILTAPFDAKRAVLTGPAVPVLEGVSGNPQGHGFFYFDVASSGAMVFVPEAPAPAPRQLVWVSREGEFAALTNDEGLYVAPALSPDGSRLAVARQDARTSEIGVFDLGRGAWTRTLHDDEPVWSPDGRWLYFLSSRSGSPEVYRTATAGGGGEEQLTRDGVNKAYLSAAPDGSGLLFAEQGAATSWDLVHLPLGAPHELRPLLTTALPEVSPVLSADGRWLAYVSQPSAAAPIQVFVRPTAQPGTGVPVSPHDCEWPRWARSGGELFFRCADKLESVLVGPGADLRPGKPRVLFEGAFGTEFDVAPDGRFVMVTRSAPEAEPPQIVYVPDWLDEMRAIYHAAPAK